MPFWRREPESRTLSALDLRPYLPLPSTTTPTTALQNPDVYACVRAVADAAASCPLISYRRLSDGGRRRLSNRTADLLRTPAEGATQANLISTAMAHLLLWGNCYLGKYRDAAGRVEQLLPIAPDRVQVERRKGRIVFTVSNDRGQQSEHGFEDIIHIKALSTDGLVGLSPIRQMRLAIELNSAVRDAAGALFRNSARPSGILSVPAQTSSDQLQEVKDLWSARSGDNAGGIAVLSGEVSFSAVAMAADDAEFVAARKLSATEIARAFRVPPWMIGAEDGGSMTYSNAESQSLSFVSYGLRPWLVVIEQSLAADRDLLTPSTYCEFLLDGLLRADSMTRAQIFTLALSPTTGWLRRDEVRRFENLEPESADFLPNLNLQTNGVPIA